ncbi:hypothetical protein ACSBR1_022131 [Camellia fascicularis]
MASDRRASPSSLLILLLSFLIGAAAALASRRRWPFQRCFSSHRCCFFPIWLWGILMKKPMFLQLLLLDDQMLKFRLIDTAGIRKRVVVASSGSTTEALSINRAFRAIRRADVVALVIEAMACITEQIEWFLKMGLT